MWFLGAALAAAVVAQPSDDDAITQYQLLEDYAAAGYPKQQPVEAAGTRLVSTADGLLSVDVVINPNRSAGGRWLRARGIQYAEHPIGALRFQPPVPLGKWNGIRRAASWGNDCINAPYFNRITSISLAPMSESCLYLNVWAPDGPANVQPRPSTRRPNGKLPVLFWIHGGSFTLGGSSAYSADGVYMYKQDAVIVTTNYRLGALGWLGGSAVQRNSTDGSGGNFGLQLTGAAAVVKDTREALRWVRRNIAAFGGDPDRITIYGESAGASLVETHLAAAKSNGLFRRAIMSSGPFDNYTVQDEPESSFVAFAEAAGCMTDGSHDANDKALACIRAKPLRGIIPGTGLMPALANTSNAGWFSPAVDGVELLETPEVSAAAGRLNKVDSVMIGTNLNEGRYLMPVTMPVPNAPKSVTADLVTWLKTYYPDQSVNEILRLYAPELSQMSVWETASVIYTESQYLCPTERSAVWIKQNSTATDVYLYRLDYEPSVFSVVGTILYWSTWCSRYRPCTNITAEDIAVGHSADVYLYWNDPRLNATDRAIAFDMIDWWTNFAATGNPNAERASERLFGATHWPSWSPQNSTLGIGVRSAVLPGLHQTRCNYWAMTHPVPYRPKRNQEKQDAGLDPILDPKK